MTTYSEERKNNFEKINLIIQHDVNTIQRKNIITTQIVDRIEAIFSGYHKDKFKIIGGNLVADLCQQCPLCNYSEGGSTVRTIINKRTGNSINVETFLPHLIRHHKFFLEFSNHNRIDPAQAIAVLDIYPNIDYGEKIRYVDSHITSEDMHDFTNEDDPQYAGIKPNWKF